MVSGRLYLLQAVSLSERHTSPTGIRVDGELADGGRTDMEIGRNKRLRSRMNIDFCVLQPLESEPQLNLLFCHSFI
jgi:hypothetical protein